MGRKRKADAIDASSETGKNTEVTNGTATTNNSTMATTMQTNITAPAGQPPVTAAKTSAAIVVATPGSNLSLDHQKTKVSKSNPIRKKSKKELKADAKKRSKNADSDEEDMEEVPDIEMPPDNILYKLVDRLEAQLPRDDHVKYDSREKKVDWKKVSWEGGLSPAECKRYWNYVQDRIRRFRIMAELIPDARHWIAHPWTNFYKSKDYNRHPDMPKKPLSMYMLYYSEKREEILADQPKLSMPEVAKICSEQYQKLSDKKKARYKQRCDEMRRQYDTRLANFYEEHPTLRPVKPDKAKKALAAKLLKQKAQEALQEQQQAAQQAAQQQAAQQQAAQQQVAQQQAAQQQAQQQLQQQQMQQQQQQQQQQQLQQQIQIQQPQFIQNGQPPQGAVQVVQNGQPMMVQNIVQTTNAAGEPIYMVQQTPMQPQPQQQQPQPRPMTALPPPSVLAHAGMTIQAQSPLPLQTPLPPHALQQGTSTPTPPPLPQAPQAIPVTLPVTLPQQPHTQQQLNQQYQIASSQANVTSSASGVAASVFSSAPERPAKPFDLYFKAQMDAHAGDTNFDRQSCAEKYRAEWKTMKLKKKAKWIKKAAENYREYDENITAFIAKNPGYVPPQHKSFLTQEDQKILDKFMGRPEKPPSSAYSLFSKEMLNNVEIKKFPSKERMAQISEKWKILPQEQKDMYQAEVNRSMGVYRQKYEDWFNGLSEAERKAETSRMNSGKSTRARNNAAAAAAAAQGLTVTAKSSPAKQRQQQQQQQQQMQQEQMQQDQQQLQQNQLIAQVAAPTPTVVEPKIVSVPAHGVTPVGPPMNLTPTLMVPTGHPMQVPPGTAGPPHGSMVTVTGAQPIPISIPTQPVQMQAATTVLNQQQAPQTVTLHHGGIIGPYKDHTALRAEILKREPVEPARSPKQLFITDWLSKHKKKKLADAKEAWKTIGKQEKKKWLEKLEPQRQKYIEDYTVFVRGLDKEELEMYTELKQKRDEEEEARRQNESSDSDSDDTSDESDDDSDSDSESDSDM